MTKLRDEFQKIVDDVANDMKIFSLRRATETAALRIQDYIDAKEPVMLTDGEMDVAYCNGADRPAGGFVNAKMRAYLRGLSFVVAAHIAKQKSPQRGTVTANVYLGKDGSIMIENSDKSKLRMPGDFWTLKATKEIEFEV